MTVSISCAGYDAYNYNPEVKRPYGYLMKFNCLGISEPEKFEQLPFPYVDPGGGEPAAELEYTLVSDKVIKDDDSDTWFIECLGPIIDISWGGGHAEPISISAIVGKDFGMNLKTKIDEGIGNDEVKELSFWVCDFDHDAQIEGREGGSGAWYEKWFPGTKEDLGPNDGIIVGAINKQGGGNNAKYAISCEPVGRPIQGASSQDLYELFVDVRPDGKGFDSFVICPGKGAKNVRKWNYGTSNQSAG